MDRVKRRAETQVRPSNSHQASNLFARFQCDITRPSQSVQVSKEHQEEVTVDEDDEDGALLALPHPASLRQRAGRRRWPRRTPTCWQHASVVVFCMQISDRMQDRRASKEQGWRMSCPVARTFSKLRLAFNGRWHPY